jgi:hypothetical protein
MINTALKIFLFVFVIATAVAVGTQSANATAVYDLILTENSSTGPTSLTVSYNGPSTFTPTNTGPDQWTIQITSMGSFDNFEHDWAEPEDPTQRFANVVSHTTDVNDKLFVTSDLNIVFDQGGPVSADNTPFSIGTDGGRGVQLTFHDLAAASEAGVPETGATLALLAVSLIALFGVSRLRSLRPA